MLHLVFGILLLVPYFYWVHESSEAPKRAGKFRDAHEERDWKIAKGLWSQEQEDQYSEFLGFVGLADDPYYGMPRTTPRKPFIP